MRIFFSVGEPSGDLHGANLIHDIRQVDPSAEFVGYGGPKMAAAGCELHYDLTTLAVMFVLQAVAKLRLFWHLVWDADRYFQAHEVDAVVLIDFPGFNWWIARRAKANNIPVFYYGVPQLWAWAPWRISKIKKYVDHVLSKLSFETSWYQSRGCQAVFVGHPYFDEIERQRIDEDLTIQLQTDERRLITLLPGSRDQEVRKNLESLVKSSRLVAEHCKDVRTAVACFNEKHVEIAREIIGTDSRDIEVYAGKTSELIRSSFCCIACSGSVSLELMYHLKPSIIQYRISPMAWVIQGFLMQCQYITLVNLFWTKDIRKRQFVPFDPDSANAEQVPFPEYLSVGDKSSAIAQRIVNWLRNETAYSSCVSQLTTLKKECAQTGASRRSAEYIIAQCSVGQENGEDSRDQANPQAA